MGVLGGEDVEDQADLSAMAIPVPIAPEIGVLPADVGERACYLHDTLLADQVTIGIHGVIGRDHGEQGLDDGGGSGAGCGEVPRPVGDGCLVCGYGPGGGRR